MKKSFIIICLFILLLPFSLMSQTPLIEPSWELSLGKPTNLEYQVPIEYRQPTGFVEMDDGCFLICLVNIMNNHIGIGGDNSKIMKLNSDGELLQEIVLPYGEDYNVLYMQLDIWNDTVNVFTLLVDVNNGDAVVMHTYLLDDLSVSEHNEIKRIEFAEFDEQQVGYNLFRILIDDKGYRTFYIELPTIISGDTFVKLLKFDDKLNLICESSTYNKKNDLNSDIHIGYLTYNADSTRYYLVSYTPYNPYSYFMNVFDLNLNVVEQICFQSNPPLFLQSCLDANWLQNPYDGKIYGFGTVKNPIINSEFFVFKVDIDNGDVDYLSLSNTGDVDNNVVMGGRGVCFLPTGDIVGCGMYDFKWLFEYAPDAYYTYIPVFDTDLRKKGEWYYSKGYEYNQHMYKIYPTKDNNGVILLGEIRSKIDEEILWEPYIVKFPASAFDTDNIEEAHAHGLHLAVAYPNPGGDVMNIRTALRNATLSVYDIQGRIVHEQEITDDITSIDASRWNSGTYVWKLTINNEQFTIKEVESGKWVKD